MDRLAQALRRAVMLATVGAALICAVPAHATTYTPAPSTPDVLQTGDGCSLREAITAANTDAAFDDCPAGSGKDTITLAAGTYTLGIGGTEDDANASGDLDITAPLELTGAGSCNTTIDAAAIDRVIDAKKYDNDVTITGVTLTGGKAPDSDKMAGAIASGGGIRAQAALSLADVVLKANAAGNGLAGAPGGDGGAIYAGGALSIKDSLITANHAGAGGPGANAPTPGPGGPGGNGGGIWSIGATTVVNTLVTDNKTGAGGNGGFSTDSSHKGGMAGAGGRGGGIEFATSTLTITRSKIANNEVGAAGTPGEGLLTGDASTPGDAAAIDAGYLVSATIDQTTISGNFGGNYPVDLLSASGSTYTIKNSTIASNKSAAAAARLLYASFTVDNSTIAGNTNPQTSQGLSAIELYGGTATVADSTIVNADPASGPFIGRSTIDMQGTNPKLTLSNSIVVGNGSGQNCSGPVTDGGHNFSWPDTTCPGTNADPKLAALADNGGPTATIALQTGSPAIDAVPASGANCPSTDQRGAARPIALGCDAGAFEVGGDRSKLTQPATGPVCIPATTPPPVETPVTPSTNPLPKVDLLKPRIGFRLTKQRLRRAVRKGYALHFTSNESGIATAIFRFRGQIVAGGQIAFSKPGKRKLTMIFSPAAKQSLPRRKRARLKLTLRVRDNAGNTAVRTIFVKLKR